MAKHDTDRLGQLVHAVNESGQTRVRSPYLHGMVLTGVLIARRRTSPPREGSRCLARYSSSGLLGKEYAKEVTAEADLHLHIRAAGAMGKAFGGSAWRRWTAGRWAQRIRKRKATGRSRGCSALEQPLTSDLAVSRPGCRRSPDGPTATTAA